MNYNGIVNNMRRIMVENGYSERNRNQIIAKFNKRFPAMRVSSGILIKAIYGIANTSGGLEPVDLLE